MALAAIVPQTLTRPQLAVLAVEDEATRKYMHKSPCGYDGITCVPLSLQRFRSVWRATSAVWDVTEENLLLPCIYQQKIASYDTNTGGLTTLHSPAKDVTAGPVLIRRHIDSFVVEFGEGLLVVYNKGLASSNSLDILSAEENSLDLLSAENVDWRIGAVRDWLYLGTEVFALADIVPSRCASMAPGECDDEWRFALVRITVGDSLEFTPLLIEAINSQARYYTLLANSYIANMGGRIYAFLPGSPNRLLEVDSDLQLRALPLPSDLGSSFDISGQPTGAVEAVFAHAWTRLSGVQSGAGIFPTRLFGWNSRLYLLYESSEKVPESGMSKPVWRLAKIPVGELERVEAPLDLPTASSRILLLPGRCNWAIVEHSEATEVDGRPLQQPSMIKLWNFRQVEY